LCISTPSQARRVGAPDHGDWPDYYTNPEPEAPPFDETSVFINVQRVGGMEIPAVIKDRQAYLPVTNLFDFLKIKNTPSLELDSVSGYFIDPGAAFCIDYLHGRITYMGKVWQLKPEDMIRTETNLYLRQEYYSQVFGLTCTFDFSNLLVKISATYDLPAVKEMQLEQMHQNLNRLKGNIKADTLIGRSFPLFRMGIADWSVTATQQSDGNDELRGSLGLGAVIAGGEANVVLNYNSRLGFQERQQFYQWRLANNDNKALRQVTLGRVLSQGAASIYDPLIGVQLTNTPTTYRRSFGTYQLSRMTQPGWTVELYVNNVLVDYTKADASGFFSFDVPLVYGNCSVKLRYYGLFGEVRTTEENITIPFNFLPKGELEYNVTAGLVQDSTGSKYGRASVNYGLTRKITIGGGSEYLSSVASGPNMPFINASVRVNSNLLLSGEYTHGVRGKGMLTYRMPLNAQLELNYTRYAKDQKAIIYNFLEERKLILSMPIRTRTFGAVTRLTYNRVLVTENSTYTTAEWMVSAAFRNVNASVNTYMISAGTYDPPRFDPYIYSNASLSLRFPKGFSLSPQAQYSYKDKSFISVKCDLEKFLFNKGYLNLSFEQNFKSNIYSIGGGLRYDLSFARVGVSSRQYNHISAVTESASGSFTYDSKTGFKKFGNRPGIGRAGITILPYLDINANGRRDKGEPKVQGLKVRISSGRIEYSKDDTVIRLYDLEPYVSYFVDISQNNFENISWQIKNKTMNVGVGPNQFKLIEVPVAVMGEVSGMVYLKDASGQKKGQGRINVCFYRADSSLAGCTSTDPEGYYSYLGLKAGEYTVHLDQGQLANLKMTAFPASLPLTISQSRDGVVVENMDFTIGAGSGKAPVEGPESDPDKGR
jgi:hypothetical protein